MARILAQPFTEGDGGPLRAHPEPSLESALAVDQSHRRSRLRSVII